jgi:hypothetical protein
VPAVDTPHLRSLVCAAGHELRVTGRCLSEDLGSAQYATFEQLAARHPIVRAFRRERGAATVGPDTLGPAGGPRPLTVLRHSNDWRGVTWHDTEAGVVWLCACGWHRSGEADDAFPIFAQLREEGRIWPAAEDYEALATDRAEQFGAFVMDDAPRLLAMARAQPETEQVLAIGLEPVAVVVYVVETLEETFVAVSGQNISIEMYQILLVALYPERSFKEWRPEHRLPTRDLDYARSEFCMSILRG